MEKITYSVPAISCVHCQRTIEKEIGALLGVQSVHVGIPTKTVEIVYDPERIAHKTLETKLAEEGYPVTDKFLVE